MKRKWVAVAPCILLLGVILFGPFLWVRSVFAKQTHFQTSTLAPSKYGIVFGASVFPDQSLSAVTQERADAAVLLYQGAIIENIFVSGDNRHNSEADAIALYLEQHGIPRAKIIVDRAGIDTGDTCRHFAEIDSRAILLTQEFHLSRAMYLCRQNEIIVTGLAVNHLGLLRARGINTFEILATRLERNTREAILLWAVILGIYDQYSNEAEILESQ